MTVTARDTNEGFEVILWVTLAIAASTAVTIPLVVYRLYLRNTEEDTRHRIRHNGIVFKTVRMVLHTIGLAAFTGSMFAMILDGAIHVALPIVQLLVGGSAAVVEIWFEGRQLERLVSGKYHPQIEVQRQRDVMYASMFTLVLKDMFASALSICICVQRRESETGIFAIVFTSTLLQMLLIGLKSGTIVARPRRAGKWLCCGDEDPEAIAFQEDQHADLFDRLREIRATTVRHGASAARDPPQEALDEVANTASQPITLTFDSTDEEIAAVAGVIRKVYPQRQQYLERVTESTVAVLYSAGVTQNERLGVVAPRIRALCDADHVKTRNNVRRGAAHDGVEIDVASRVRDGSMPTDDLTTANAHRPLCVHSDTVLSLYESDTDAGCTDAQRCSASDTASNASAYIVHVDVQAACTNPEHPCSQPGQTTAHESVAS
uniref:Uncharacterized protein n=1 Tax=Neobodo designis TaxID=312471 RepID=A0A7S1L8D0_NEODS|mmetsp:Transcript_16854/g.52341  ORF Transcript_16854/g.52341 Transcript_16854/m.52341 type:complete len:434 (+) Transcript_16854:167-1468(+)